MSGKGQGSGIKESFNSVKIKTQMKGNTGKQPPAKRTITEVSNDSTLSNDSMNMSVIQNQLDIMTENLEELKVELKGMIKKEDIESIISKSISCALNEIKKEVEVMVKTEIKEKTKELNDKIVSLEFENSQLKETLTKTSAETEKKLKQFEERLFKNENEVKDANKKANYNEQYSRKNNIKIMDITEEKNENTRELTDKVINILQQKDVILEKSEILAIHRIPTKKHHTRPVLIKTVNNDVKSRIMRRRKAMKEAGHKLVDDVTILNSGLINRLLLHSSIKSAWFFNGSVYGLTDRDERIKFDLYDSISDVIKNFREKMTQGTKSTTY